MRVPFLLAALALSTTAAVAQTPPANVAADADAPATAVEIGPWRIQVSLIDGLTFDRCMMSRTTDSSSASAQPRAATSS